MAVLKVRNSNGKASLGGAKDYLERDGRNVECSTFNIDRPEEWAEDMQLTKELFDKTEGRQYYWIVQSFDNEQWRTILQCGRCSRNGQGTGRSVCEKRVSSCS